ncbi:MAG TPA: VOC family protein [Candidatus Xenobia bacterium]|jgi:PhnB protein
MKTHWQPKDKRTITIGLPGGARLIQFLQQVFDARVLDRYDDAEGKVMHAEIAVGDSCIMTGDGTDEFTLRPAGLHVYVPEVDVAWKKAVEAGATTKQPPQDQFYGDRTAKVVDPFGNLWSIATHQEDVSDEEMARRVKAWEATAGSSSS